MKLRLAIMLSLAQVLTLVVWGQQSQTLSLRKISDTKGACPSPAAGKTAWFDTCQYLPVANGVTPPRALTTPDPEYSESARKGKITGRVIMAVAINASGTVDAVKVVRSLEPTLDQNAIDAVRHWTFEPATKDGEAVPVQIQVEVNFRTF